MTCACAGLLVLGCIIAVRERLTSRRAILRTALLGSLAFAANISFYLSHNLIALHLSLLLAVAALWSAEFQRRRHEPRSLTLRRVRGENERLGAR